MSFDFEIDRFADLSLHDQIRRCRAMAVEARNFADATADRDLRDSYLDLANRWEVLADEMDNHRAQRTGLRATDGIQP